MRAIPPNETRKIKDKEKERMMKKIGLLGVVFAMLLFVAGCGQELKKENEQLKGQISTLTEENNNLKNQAATLQKESGDLKAQVESLTAERDALKKELEAAKAKPKAAAKPVKKAVKSKKR